MKQPIPFLDNREFALVIWLIVISIWFLSKRNFRQSTLQLFQSFFKVKIIIPAVVLILYVAGIVFYFYTIEIWEVSYVGDTIIWFFGVAFVMFVNINKAGEDDYLKKLIIDSIKIIIIIEYVMNFYVFNLWIELLLVPIFTILWCMVGFASAYTDYESVESILNTILGILGLILIGITTYNIITDYDSLIRIGSLFEFLNPIILTLLVLPIIYIFGVWVSYEMLFVRMKFIIKDDNLRRFAKRKTLTSFHINLKGLKRWSKKINLVNLESKEDVIIGIKDSKSISA